MKLVIRIPKLNKPKVLLDIERVKKIKSHYVSKLPKFRQRDGKKHKWKCGVLIPIEGYHPHTGKYIYKGLSTFIAWDIYKDDYYANPFRVDYWTSGKLDCRAYNWYQSNLQCISSVYDKNYYIIKEI